MNKPGVGTIAWVDLTVSDAPKVKDSYEAVVGWKSQACNQGGLRTIT